MKLLKTSQTTKASSPLYLRFIKFISPLARFLPHLNIKTDAFAETEKFLENDAENKAFVEENVNDIADIFDVENQTEQDILQNILSKSDQDLKVQVSTSSLNDSRFEIKTVEEEEVLDYVNPLLPYLRPSYIFATSAVALALLSWLMFSVQLDESNYVLSQFGQNNIALVAKNLQTKLDDINKRIKEIDLKLAKLAKEQVDIPALVALQEINHQSIDWFKVRQTLFDATLVAFPYNDILHYISYESFSGNRANSSINISGKVVDPAGRVFLRLAKLVNAINNHPDFSGAEVKSFAKTKGGGEKSESEDDGVYSTSFSMTLKYLPAANSQVSAVKDPKKDNNDNQ